MTRKSFVGWALTIIVLALMPLPAWAADVGFLDLALNPAAVMGLAFMVGTVTLAKNQPVKKPRKEVHSGDAKIAQPTDVVTDLDEPLNLDPDVIVVTPEEQRMLNRQYYERLKFNNDWLTVVIAESAGDENMPQYTDYVACRGQEPFLRLADGSMIKTCGYLPRGVEITIQRKFIENMLRAKKMKVSHDVNPDKKNELRRQYVPSTQISLIGASREDQEWFMQLARGRG
jgi:hypothetical protein